MHSAPADRSLRTSHHADPTAAEMAADLVLEPGIAVAGLDSAGHTLRHVLLTGATGFLGAYLLRDLLRQTVADVTCLVRAAKSDEARARIEGNLHRYGLTLSADEWSRVKAIAADLAQPRFGVDDATYAGLAETIDTIFHGAAVVNFYQTYRELRPTNVGGTREMLRFAVRGRLKVLHYISTTGVFDSDAARGVVVRETDAPAHCDGSVMGYTQTKWVAEQLALQARARGLPVSVYRTPFIMGDSESGVVDEDNLVVKMLIGSIQGGAWPEEPTDVEMVPVNALSRAVLHLAQTASSPAQTFHITSPHPMRWHDIGLAARAYGYALNLLPYGEWKRELARFARQKNNAMRPLLRFYTKVPRRLSAPAPEVFTRQPRPIFNSVATQATLAPAGLVPPRMTHALFGTYLDYFVSRGWLLSPADRKQAAPVEKRSTGSRPPQMICGTPA